MRCVSAYNKAEPTLSPTAKAARQKDIQTKQSEYQQRVQQLEQQAQQRQAELMRPIMQQINKVIEQIRAEDGLAMVFDAGNQAGVVVAADSSLDITAEGDRAAQGRGADLDDAAGKAGNWPSGSHDQADRRLANTGSKQAVMSRDVTRASLGGEGKGNGPSLTAEAIARLVGGTVRGNGETRVRRRGAARSSHRG